MPLTHTWTTTQSNNPAYDVSADVMHGHIIDGDMDATAAATEPAVPAAGKIRHFFKITGTTPNRNVVIGYKLEDGTVINLVDVTI